MNNPVVFAVFVLKNSGAKTEFSVTKQLLAAQQRRKKSHRGGGCCRCAGKPPPLTVVGGFSGEAHRSKPPRPIHWKNFRHKRAGVGVAIGVAGRHGKRLQPPLKSSETGAEMGDPTQRKPTKKKTGKNTKIYPSHQYNE